MIPKEVLDVVRRNSRVPVKVHIHDRCQRLKGDLHAVSFCVSGFAAIMTKFRRLPADVGGRW